MILTTALRHLHVLIYLQKVYSKSRTENVKGNDLADSEAPPRGKAFIFNDLLTFDKPLSLFFLP